MGQPRLELDGAIQLFEGQVQLVQPAVSLGQVDIGLVRVRLPLDRRFQVGDGVFESLLPDAQNPAIDGEHIAGIVIEGHLRGLLEVGIGRAPRLQLLVSEAPQQIKPDKIGALSQTGAEQGPGLGGPPLAQQADRIEILRPEMAWLALEHLIEFLDRLAEFLATIQLIGHQEVIENLVEGSALGRLLGLRRCRRDRRACSGSVPAAGEKPGTACRSAGPVRGNSGLYAGIVPFRAASGRTRTVPRSRRESAEADSNLPGSRPSGVRSGRHRVWGEPPPSARTP